MLIPLNQLDNIFFAPILNIQLSHKMLPKKVEGEVVDGKATSLPCLTALMRLSLIDWLMFTASNFSAIFGTIEKVNDENTCTTNHNKNQSTVKGPLWLWSYGSCIWGALFLIAGIKMGLSLVFIEICIKYTFIVINVSSVGTCVANWACSMLLAFDQKFNTTDIGWCPGYTPQVFRFFRPPS